MQVRLVDIAPSVAPLCLLGRRVSVVDPLVPAALACSVCSRSVQAKEDVISAPQDSFVLSTHHSEKDALQPPQLALSYKWARLSLGIPVNTDSGLVGSSPSRALWSVLNDRIVFID